jgi:hypothetical protein
MEAGEFADRAGQRHKRIAAGGEEPRSAAPTGAASEGRDGVRYLCIENFLPPVEHARTLDLFADDDEAFDRAELRGMFERHLRRVLPHVRRELGLAWFPFGSIEHRVSAAQGGAPFAAQFDGDRDILANCPLICLYRFHRQSKRFSGGDLRIWADETGEAGRGRRSGHVDVDLPDNAAVLFPGDLRWQMGPIDYESTAPDARCFSISLWFRRGQIPESLAQRRAGERLGLFGSGSQGQRDSS